MGNSREVYMLWVQLCKEYVCLWAEVTDDVKK